MRLGELSGRRVALLGLGIDVRAAVGPIIASGPNELVVVDSGVSADSVEVGGHQLAVVSLDRASTEAEVLVRSPGFPRYLPELVEARKRGVAMTTPVDLYLGTVAPDQRVVMITGTKGKSTTTELIGRFAAASGLRVGVAGNLGIPVFDEGWDSKAPAIVLEVSSYQGADIHHAPDIAVITSIAEDHLSWHGGLDAYLRDKLRVVENDGGRAQVVVVPAEETHAIEVLKERFPEIVPVLVPAATAGAVAHEDTSNDRGANDQGANGGTTRGGTTLHGAPPAGMSPDYPAPVHRVRNASVAAAVVEMLGAAPLSTEEVLNGASLGMPGRLDICPAPPDLADVTFVDDALASNPSATAAGLAWARSGGLRTIVILGGYSRQVSIDPLAVEAAEWLNPAAPRLGAVTLPLNGAEVATNCGIEIVGEASTVTEAVRIAVGALDGSGMVLFSPAAPTPPGKGNWQTRSDEFRKAVLGVSAP